ncbi:hypothetical protein Q5692_19185 [Microcoleus sp. C2C3]|uniref:hypothetical protein n=1 Tax=unclassified Microcoleus TaxID=2642155 RepID=UPI002FCF2EF3
MPFPYPKIIVARARGQGDRDRTRCNYRPIHFRETVLPIGVNNRLKALINLVFT